LKQKKLKNFLLQELGVILTINLFFIYKQMKIIARQWDNGKAVSQLIDFVSNELKAEGLDETQYNLEKAIEVKNAQKGMFETKANEVMNTW